MKYNIEDLEIGERVFVSTLFCADMVVYKIDSIFLKTNFVIVGLEKNISKGKRKIRFDHVIIARLDVLDKDLNILNEL